MILRLFSDRPVLCRRAVLGVALLLCPAFCGCGAKKTPWETVYPAKGSVTINGKPVADADISLFPEDNTYPESVRPRAKSGEDGTFTIWTYEKDDGAPAGRYKVTIVHNEVSISQGAVVTRPNDLPAKYARRESTDLYAEIIPDSAELPAFDLK